MTKHFNKAENKNAYFFSDKEVKQIINILIEKKFKWIIHMCGSPRTGLFKVFRLEQNFKSTQIEINVNSNTLTIWNDSEIAKIVLDTKLYQDLLLGIQDMVVEERT